MKNLRFVFAGIRLSQQTIAGGNYPYFPLTKGMQYMYSNSDVNIQNLHAHTEVYVMKPHLFRIYDFYKKKEALF